PIRLACVKIIHINGTSGSTNSTSTTNPLSVCPMNQTMSDCLNKCSEEKCPGIGISMMCTKHCGQGCACAAGFVRSSNGECYKSKDCPLEQVCGDNEEYRCENCAATCKNPEPNCPELHNKKCNKKCICAAGFVKKNGKCVTLASCPDHDHNNITCLGTEEYTDCLPKCRQLCSGSTQCNKNSHTDMCTPGCVCRPSYKLDSNGTCVHNKHCFKTTDCPVNEEWSKCISLDNVCGMATIQKVPLRNQCFSGCVCAAGFARNSNGTCVEQDKC
ncbi:Protein CBG24902, partial [Caenorhabditis briggsae]